MTRKKIKFKFELGRRMKILVVTVLVSLALIIGGIVSSDLRVAGQMIILSTFIIAGPQIILAYGSYRDLKEAEDRFPTFLRNLTESIRSGMPFHQSIVIASKFNYGSLTNEVKKMSNQLSWGMTLDKVLDMFAERMKKSKRIFTATKIIRESYSSGGDEVSILESVADNLTLLGDSEKEKKSLLNQYVLMMYAISLVFIGIVVAINNLLIPIFSQSTTGAAQEIIGLQNPCANIGGAGIYICDLFQGTAQYILNIEQASFATSISSYYISLFFMMALIQSLFSGLVAGQISENSLRAGIKHSLILVAITVGSFIILIGLGLLGV